MKHSKLFIALLVAALSLWPIQQAFAAKVNLSKEHKVSSISVAQAGLSAETTPNPQAFYTVTFVNITAPDTVVQVKAGMCVKKPADPAPPSQGAKFLGWMVIGQPYNIFDFDTPITSDLVLAPAFTYPYIPPPPPPPLHSVTVSFDSIGGTKVSDQEITSGKKAAKPNGPTKKGYKFLGWYTKDGKKWDFSQPVTGDMTLYAHWKALPKGGKTLPPTGDPGASPLALAALLGASGTLGLFSLRKKRPE